MAAASPLARKHVPSGVDPPVAGAHRRRRPGRLGKPVERRESALPGDEALVVPRAAAGFVWCKGSKQQTHREASVNGGGVD